MSPALGDLILPPSPGLSSPRAFAGTAPFLRQSASSGSSPTVTLPAVPVQGSVLLLGSGSIQAGEGSASGGGATWTRIGRTVIPSGNQIEIALWMGVVGSSPSAACSLPWVSTGNDFVAEISKGLTGQVMTVTATTGGGAISTTSRWSRPPAWPAANSGVFVIWYITRNASGTMFPQTGWSIDTGVVASGVAYRMALRPYVFNRDLVFSAPTGGANNHAVISAIIA